MCEDAVADGSGTQPADQAIALVDGSGSITAWSDGARRLLGYSAAEAVGRMARDLLTAGLPEAALRGWAVRESWAATVQGRGRDGHRVNMPVHAQPLTRGDGEVLWMLTAGDTRPPARSRDAEPSPGLGQRSGPETADDTAEQYRRRLSIISEAILRIGTTLDLKRTAEELAEIGTDRIADFVVVDLLDGVLDGNEVEAAPPGRLVFCRAAQRSVLEGCPESVVPVGHKLTHLDQSPPGRALATGRGSRHRIDEAAMKWWAADSPDRQRSMEKHGIHSVLIVPLQARGTTLGLAIFCRHQSPEPFTEDDLTLVEELTGLAAVCVDNARRYARERATAVALQKSLLPQHVPPQAAVDVASRYLPACAQVGVGGDWYDVIPLSGARVALVVGDVVGRGLRASATMGRLRTAVHTLADVDLAPAELLTSLDDVVVRLGREQSAAGDLGDSGEISATCLYAVYDPVSRRCTVASAGHVPLAVVSPEGKVSFPDLTVGPPLGLGGLPFEAVEFDVPEGSVLALYTDGLVEDLERDFDTGLAIMRRTLGMHSASLEQTCDRLLEALQNGRQADDVALLLARTRALDTSQVASWSLPADPAIVAEARKAASEQLVKWGLEDSTFTTELVVSELVTNAIRYGGGPIQLRLIRDAALICEVSDASSTAPHLRRARVFDEGGRGLLLVAQLTDRWGTRQVPSGKIIWAEQALAGASPQAR
ncbi:SpoIIE family protein phosphatase [Streptomyces mirabilis]|uniref:ATP-binding SpoIIE family protein phosphatase n=1 Tax=Streptomyces mirabilis TaxID=68239 RepID=UPI00364B2C26